MFVYQLGKDENEDVRNVLRCVTKKYKNDKNNGHLEDFNIFMEEARDLWKMIVVEEKQVPSLKFPLLCLPVDLLTTSCSGA